MKVSEQQPNLSFIFKKESHRRFHEVKFNAELTKPVELADEKIAQSNETKVEEAIHIEPAANTEGVLQKSDIKEEVKSEETSQHFI